MAEKNSAVIRKTALADLYYYWMYLGTYLQTVRFL